MGTDHRRGKCEGYFPNSLRPISYLGIIWELYVLGLKTEVFWRKNNQIHGQGNQCQINADSLAEITPSDTKNSAQNVCSSPKVWNFWKKLSLGVRSPWARFCPPYYYCPPFPGFSDVPMALYSAYYAHRALHKLTKLYYTVHHTCPSHTFSRKIEENYFLTFPVYDSKSQYFFSNLNFYCSKSSDMRNLQEQNTTIILKQVYLSIRNINSLSSKAGYASWNIKLIKPTDERTNQKWYFVTKIVLTYCEKKLF